jgi:hypothetical protein
MIRGTEEKKIKQKSSGGKNSLEGHVNESLTGAYIGVRQVRLVRLDTFLRDPISSKRILSRSL